MLFFCFLPFGQSWETSFNHLSPPPPLFRPHSPSIAIFMIKKFLKKSLFRFLQIEKSLSILFGDNQYLDASPLRMHWDFTGPSSTLFSLPLRMPLRWGSYKYKVKGGRIDFVTKKTKQVWVQASPPSYWGDLFFIVNTTDHLMQWPFTSINMESLVLP